MKLTQSRSCTTVIVSPVSSAPRPSDPAGQCSTAAPSKCPPIRASVSPGTGSTASSKSSTRGGGSLDPLLVRARDEDAGVERVGELDVGGVEVRVRHADRVDAAELGDPGARRVIQQRHAVPQDVAARRAHQQRPLPDREGGLHSDADQVGLLLADHRRALGADLGHGGPLLAAPADVLPLVQADGAAAGRLLGVGVLDGAGPADPRGHGGSSSQLGSAAATSR